MESIMEEYGGVTAGAFAGILMLALLAHIFGAGGWLQELLSNTAAALG
ncbi:MAG: hypothetical protein IJ567_10235 [Lachnospiraceae bacterium]|nr:hypothetical protein [Lachnospiraceae bacterium]